MFPREVTETTAILCFLSNCVEIASVAIVKAAQDRLLSSLLGVTQSYKAFIRIRLKDKGSAAYFALSA